MKLEELIQKRFVSTAALAERLTTYNGVPAVFSPEAPGDEQDGWGGETQYPMVTYNYDLQANEERNNKGLWHYIRQKDYNIYYAENRIYTKFSEIEADIQEER